MRKLYLLFKDFQIFNNNCISECFTLRGPDTYTQCVFPFVYNEATYHGCPSDYLGPWCATKVDDNGNYVPKKGFWGYCNSACPLQEGKK